ncbi:MAG: RNA polymerase sigma-70 factor [Tannerellaceae bacterium]|jgi:RNA polymerase sigma-70 factor (ECF subfamily)|nr:RNA polymerase sigma-70 factor [Tannerellaceae bacterium]
MKPITEQTIEALRDGSHRAFEDVFLAYFNKIKHFIFGYIKSEADAEELAQDIFVNLWINRHTIDVSKSVSSYMHTIARNTALNFLKHKFIKESYETDGIRMEAHSSEDELIAKETQLLIEMAIEQMPEQRRLVYRLSRNDGLKNEEIAIRLHTTKRNVESQLSLALKGIRKAIATTFLFFP